MLKQLIFFLCALILLNCSNTIHSVVAADNEFSRFEFKKYLENNNTGTVHLKNGQVIEADSIDYRNNLLSWKEIKNVEQNSSKRSNQHPVDSIENIMFVENRLACGLRTGGLMVIISPVTIVIGSNLINRNDRGDVSYSFGEALLVSSFFSPIIGLLSGAAVGDQHYWSFMTKTNYLEEIETTKDDNNFSLKENDISP
jgi:hypothetical protein